MQIYAHGVRNSVGFDWHPVTGDLWFTDNGRDWMGDNNPPDELNLVSESGQHFGFPYCHGGEILDAVFGSGHDCSNYVPPERKLGPHVAALGMRFYSGECVPGTQQCKDYRKALC
jgi:glucose/arabinose dehydrogenase